MKYATAQAFRQALEERIRREYKGKNIPRIRKMIAFEQLMARLVERKSRFTLLKKIDRRTAEATKVAIIQMLKPYRTKTLTITCDDGKEFADHQEFAKELDAEVYFAHAYASWERGSNENSNGLSRQYFPKGSDFSKITDLDTEFAEKRLNTRPRKCLNIRTPEMVFFELSDVALVT